MKKQSLSMIIGLTLVLAAVTALKSAAAQTVGETAAKPEIQKLSAEERAKIKQLARRRLSAANLFGALGDPCDESVPIAFDQPLNGTLSTTDCTLPDDTLIDFYSFQGTAGQAISISLNSANFDSYLFLFDPDGNIVQEDDDGGTGTNSRIPDFGGDISLPVTGTYLIGANSFEPETGNYTVRLSRTAACQPTPLVFNQTVNGTLTGTDCIINPAGEFFLKDFYTFEGVAGQQISIAMNSSDVNSYLILHTPSGDGRLEDDNGGGGFNARIPSGNAVVTLTQTGTYTIEAGPFESGETGAYSLILNGSATPQQATAAFDFDGDRKTDISIFRPSVGEWWYAGSTNGQVSALQFGSGDDKLVSSDFTGDGKTDIAVWRPASGEWFVLRSESGSFYSFPFGVAGDVPAPADYDGDGRADAAVFRPSSATWFIQRSGDGGTSIIRFGVASDVPAPADYDGDGKADLAIFRGDGTNGAEWWYTRSIDGQVAALQFGAATDKPLRGDFTGDGRADIAVFRPAGGTWFILRSEDLSFYSFPLGTAGDVPAPGDYDGDGKTDAAVFRPATATWFVERSTAGTLITGFGITGDIPVPGAYIP